MNFRPISFEIQLPEMTFKPISIADRNAVPQTDLRSEPCRSGFVDALNDCRLSWSLWKYMCIKMTHGSLICASTFKSVRNRPAVVRYREPRNTYFLYLCAGFCRKTVTCAKISPEFGWTIAFYCLGNEDNRNNNWEAKTATNEQSFWTTSQLTRAVLS